MTDKRLTQSPRSLRDSTESAEQYAKGDVNIGINAFRRDGGPENEGASKLFDKRGDVKQPGWVRDN